MHIKPMIAAAVLSAGFAAVAMGSVADLRRPPVFPLPVAAPRAIGHGHQGDQEVPKKHKSKKTTATDTMSSPK